MTSPVPPVELWNVKSMRALLTPTVTEAELVFDWLTEGEEALVIDVSYSTPPGTSRHAILVDWYDPTVGEDQYARKVVAQVNDNAVFWNPVRWFVPRIMDSDRRWVLRASCAVPAGVTASLDVSIAIVRSSPKELR